MLIPIFLYIDISNGNIMNVKDIILVTISQYCKDGTITFNALKDILHYHSINIKSQNISRALFQLYKEECIEKSGSRVRFHEIIITDRGKERAHYIMQTMRALLIPLMNDSTSYQDPSFQSSRPLTSQNKRQVIDSLILNGYNKIHEEIAKIVRKAYSEHWLQGKLVDEITAVVEEFLDDYLKKLI